MLKPNFNSNSSRQVLLRLGYNNCLYCIVSHNSKKKRKEGKKKKKKGYSFKSHASAGTIPTLLLLKIGSF